MGCMQATAHLINLFVSLDKHFKGQLSTDHSVWQVDDKVERGYIRWNQTTWVQVQIQYSSGFWWL